MLLSQYGDPSHTSEAGRTIGQCVRKGDSAVTRGGWGPLCVTSPTRAPRAATGERTWRGMMGRAAGSLASRGGKLCRAQIAT